MQHFCASAKGVVSVAVIATDHPGSIRPGRRGARLWYIGAKAHGFGRFAGRCLDRHRGGAGHRFLGGYLDGIRGRALVGVDRSSTRGKRQGGGYGENDADGIPHGCDLR
jgi:hypothetical protein